MFPRSWWGSEAIVVEMEMQIKRMMQWWCAMFRHLCAYFLYGSLLRPHRYLTLASTDLFVKLSTTLYNSPPVFYKSRQKLEILIPESVGSCAIYVVGDNRRKSHPRFR